MDLLEETRDLLLPGWRGAEITFFGNTYPIDFNNDVQSDMVIVRADDLLELTLYDPKSKRTLRDRPPCLSRAGIESKAYRSEFYPAVVRFCKNAKSEFKRP